MRMTSGTGPTGNNLQVNWFNCKLRNLSLDTVCLLQQGRYRYQVLLAKVLIRFWLLIQGMKQNLKQRQS